MADTGWLSAEAFSSACAALPLVSIDLFITRLGASDPELLLGQRRNRPAEDWWFTPGGRIRKNESLQHAMVRIAREEVGLAPASLDAAELIGAWDHFYPDSAFDVSVSTHYVNLPYLIRLHDSDAARRLPSLPQDPGAQHSAWRWAPFHAAVLDPYVHENVRVVVRRLIKTASFGGYQHHDST